MIEKKMLEKVNTELAKKHAEDEVFKREVETRTAQREREIEGERKQLILEMEIKLRTAREAREDAEAMAKFNTVGSMVEAAGKTGLIQDGQPAEAPEALHARLNQMLVQSGQMALTSATMAAFDTVWADQ